MGTKKDNKARVKIATVSRVITRFRIFTKATRYCWPSFIDFR